MTKMPFFLLFPLATLLHLASGEIRNLKISSDHRPIMFLDFFAFTHTSHVTISVSMSSISTHDPTKLGFLLLNHTSFYEVIMQSAKNTSTCILHSHSKDVLFNFSSLSPSPTSSFNYSHPIHSPDEYALLFANCEPEPKVSMHVHTEMYNMDNGRTRDYLSAGSTHIPTLCFILSLIYIFFLGIWIHVCLREKKSVYKIHVLMGVLLIMKLLSLLLVAGNKYYIKVTGTAHGLDVLFYIFRGIKVVLLFTVIVLIGTGWSFLKPCLQAREKKVLMFVIPVQVLANVAHVVIGETGPYFRNFMMWNEVFLCIDIVCCCAIIVPIVWSIRSKAARNLSKLSLFRQFYIVVIVYLYFTKIVVFALGFWSNYKYRWVGSAVEEVASLAFYMFMFYRFKPAEKNEYFVIDE